MCPYGLQHSDLQKSGPSSRADYASLTQEETNPRNKIACLHDCDPTAVHVGQKEEQSLGEPLKVIQLKT